MFALIVLGDFNTSLLRQTGLNGQQLQEAPAECFHNMHDMYFKAQISVPTNFNRSQCYDNICIWEPGASGGSNKDAFHKAAVQMLPWVEAYEEQVRKQIPTRGNGVPQTYSNHLLVYSDVNLPVAARGRGRAKQ